jgi:hypothetical protein
MGAPVYVTYIDLDIRPDSVGTTGSIDRLTIARQLPCNSDPFCPAEPGKKPIERG